MDRNHDQPIVGRLSLWVNDINPSRSYWLLLFTDYGIYNPENSKVSDLLNRYTTNSFSAFTHMMDARTRLDVTLDFFLWLYTEDKQLCFEVMKRIYDDFKDEDDSPEPYEYVDKLEEYEGGSQYPDVDIDDLVRATPQVIGDDEEFEFYKRIHPYFEDATEKVFIIDSYVDEEVFDLYLSETSDAVEKRILTKKTQGRFDAVAEKFVKRSDHEVEVRQHDDCHDRLLFVDDRCFAVGISLKDAGRYPTYIVEFESVEKFREPWEDLWTDSEEYQIFQ